MSPPLSPSAAPPFGSTAPPSGAPPTKEKVGRKRLLLFLLFLLVLSVVAISLFVVTLSDITAKSPRFYLSDLHGPPIDASPGSAVTVCQFTIRNSARLLFVNYNNLDITLRHPSGREATGTIPRFRQGFHTETKKEVALQFGSDTPAAAPRNRSATAGFRVSLQTRYRNEGASKTRTWIRVRRSSDVEVNTEGKMTSRERILLVSAGAPGVASTGWLAVVAAVGWHIFIV